MWQDLLRAADVKGCRPLLEDQALLHARQSGILDFKSSKLHSFDFAQELAPPPRTRRVHRSWRTDLGFAISVNICPWCLRHFATPKITRTHVRAAVVTSGLPRCPTICSKPRIHHAEQRPKRLECRICDHDFSKSPTTEFLDHIVHHYSDPSSSSSSSDSDSSNSDSGSSMLKTSTSSAASNFTESESSSSTDSDSSSNGADDEAVLGGDEGQGQSRWQGQAEQATENTTLEPLAETHSCLLQIDPQRGQGQQTNESRPHAQRIFHQPLSGVSTRCSRGHYSNQGHQSSRSGKSYMDGFDEGHHRDKENLAHRGGFGAQETLHEPRSTHRLGSGLLRSYHLRPVDAQTGLVDTRHRPHRCGFTGGGRCGRWRGAPHPSSTLRLRERDTSDALKDVMTSLSTGASSSKDWI